ncbi:MAG: VWA domain-containing protein [Desulfobacterales bacterium]|nr:VWA domain-containing protein [Desulfobacterales bacterium]
MKLFIWKSVKQGGAKMMPYIQKQKSMFILLTASLLIIFPSVNALCEDIDGTTATYSRMVVKNSSQNETCTPVTSIEEHFETEALPECWNAISNENGIWVFDDPDGRGDSFDSDLKFALADGFRGVAIDTDLQTPSLDLSDRPTAKLTFKTWFYYSSGSGDVDISTDSGNTWKTVLSLTSHFNSYWTDSSGNFYSFMEQTTDLSEEIGGESDVLIRFRANNMKAVWIVDDVILETVAEPSVPVNLSATLGKNSVVNLAWESEDSPKPGFEIERSPDGEDWTKIADISDGATTYVDNAVESYTKYYYQVRSVNSAGTSDYCDSVNVTTEDRTVIVYDIIVSYYDDAENTVAKKEPIENNIKYFADGVYEESNGAQKLGRVTIYTDGTMTDNADIVWTEECWPSANISGYGKDNRNIRHCDIFTNNGNPVDFLEEGDGQIYGGLTISHEWGHYFHSLYDEYQGSGSCDADDPGHPCESDTPVQDSVMNSQWKAIDGNYEWLNFSTSLNNTEDTAQHRVYDASGWETLARSLSEDPRDGQLSNEPVRLYHSELEEVAPEAGQAPSVELQWPEGQGQTEARDKLDFVWADLNNKRRNQANTSGRARLFVIDCSNSMSKTHLTDINAVIKQGIDRIEIGDTIGIITFCDDASVTYPLTTINSDADKQDLKTATDGITFGNCSADISNALAKALQEMTENVPKETSRAVYLITSGQQHESGENPFSVISAFQKAYVKLYVFNYSADEGIAADMRQLAEQTGGSYRFISNISELQKALASADDDISPFEVVKIRTAWDVLEKSAPYETLLYIDSTLKGFAVFTIHTGDVTIELFDPENSIAADFSPVYSETIENEQGAMTMHLYLVENTMPGSWRLKTTLINPGDGFFGNLFFYDVTGGVSKGKQTFDATVESIGGDVVEYPKPILVSGSVSKEFPITGITVKGITEAPNGDTEEFVMQDDGVPPDARAEDGMYAALLTPVINGTYNITVIFDNNSGTGNYTNKSSNYSPAFDGTIPEQKLWPAEERFERVTDIQVTVTGSQGAGFNDENAVALTTDNRPVTAKIDFAGDTDTFIINVPEDYAGELVVRIDSLGLGMAPYLLIYNEDRSLVLENWLDFESASNNYLSVKLFPPDQTLYAEVWHMDELAGMGLYNISAGPRLLNERMTSVPGDADGNGTVDIFDALTVAQYAAGLKTRDELAGFDMADTDGNGTVDIYDALRIAQYAVGLIPGFD